MNQQYLGFFHRKIWIHIVKIGLGEEHWPYFVLVFLYLHYTNKLLQFVPVCLYCNMITTDEIFIQCTVCMYLLFHIVH